GGRDPDEALVDVAAVATTGRAAVRRQTDVELRRGVAARVGDDAAGGVLGGRARRAVGEAASAVLRGARARVGGARAGRREQGDAADAGGRGRGRAASVA